MALALSLVVATGIVGTLHALRIEHRLDALVPTLQQAETDARNGQLGEARVELLRAQTSLASANSALYDSPDFEALRFLPIARQNLDAVRSGVRLGLELVDGGQQILDAASPLESSDGRLSVPISGGQVPLATINNVGEEISALTNLLPRTPTAPSGPLILGRVHAALEKLYSQAATRRGQLLSASQSISLIEDIAGGNGPRRYLIAVANTAEMRGSGGMILSYGVLDSDDGVVTLGKFGPIDDLTLHQRATVSLPGDFLASYGSLGPSLNWRNANMMSDFTQVGPVLDAMYTKATGLAVDGVIQIDPAGLAAILAGTGPVDVPPLGQVTASNVVSLVLNQAYLEFPDRTVRQDYLATVARTTFARLVDLHASDLSSFAVALSHAVTSRHIVMYDTSPTTEDILNGLHAAGGLPGPGVDFAQLTIQNFGGDKMDYYLQSAVTLRGRRPPTAIADLTATISLHDTAPPNGKPAYIFGPFNGDGDAPGTYRGLVTLYLPFGSYLESDEAGPFVTTPPTEGTQNRITAITYSVVIPPGASSAVTLHLQIPPPNPLSSRFLWIPSPRINPTTEIGESS